MLVPEGRLVISTHHPFMNHALAKGFTSELLFTLVRLAGIRLCEPCHYLEEMTTKGVLVGLIHRGGLRANVLNSGFEGLAREKNIALKPAETRRNLVTRGVPLNHLVGKEFQVGDVARHRCVGDNTAS